MAQDKVTRVGSLELTSGTVVDNSIVPTIATAAEVTYTPDQILQRFILRDTAGAARADLLPTAAAMILAMNKPAIGASFEFVIRNTASAANSITVTTNTGLTLSGTMTIAQNNSRRFKLVVTGSAAVTIYSLGTVVF